MSAIYRYESYIKSLPPHYGKRFKKKKGKEQYVVKFTTKEIIELHIQYCRLAAIAEDYDYIVSFACGGIPLLDYISEAESWRLFGKEFPSTDSETKTLHRKLKLFPGLSWGTSKDSNGEDLFREWLNKVSANKKLLIIDCSLTGGAIAFLGKIEGIANKWKKDITSVNKLFSSTLPAELSFLSHHLKKRQIVKGLIIPELVEFMEMSDLLMVTLNKSHIHENKKYSEFTFLIPVENFKSSQVEELDSIVPVCYKKHFDNIWPILSDRERKTVKEAIKKQTIS